MDKYSYIANAHGSSIEQLYESYQSDPESIDHSWQRFFEGFDFYQTKFGKNGTATPATNTESNYSEKEVLVRDLIHAYRSRAHLRSTTNPVRKRKERFAILDLEDFGLTEGDLDTEFEVGNLIGIGRATLRKIIESLKLIYEGTVGFEYMYIRRQAILDWFKKKSEYEALNFNPSVEEKKRILLKLNEAVVFENFLHTKYIGQ